MQSLNFSKRSNFNKCKQVMPFKAENIYYKKGNYT